MENPPPPPGGVVVLIVNFAEKRPCVIFASKPFKDVEFLHLSYVLELLYWNSSAASRPFDKNASFEVQYILGNFWLCPLPLFFYNCRFLH